MSSKRNTFECFVHLYDVKYRISLPDVDNGYVLFDQLYREVQKIDPKQDVSFETNTFEIYDKRRDRFQRITSFSQVIDDNSRVRVLLKPQLFKNYLSDPSDNKLDVLNSYQTTDYHRSQSIDSNGNQFADRYNNICNKSNFQLNGSQMKDSQCWPPSAQQLTAHPTLVGQSMGPTVGPLVSPAMGFGFEPSMPSSSSRSSLSGYCPKIVEYDNGSNFDRSYSSGLSQTNEYQFDSSNISSIIDKLMESQNQLMREKTIEELRREGIELKVNFNLEMYLCKVCDEVFQTSEAAVKHSRSTEHSEKKLGIFADDLDRSLIIPSENLADINVVLARKQELKRLDTKTKYEFRRHGIRIKDGIGVNAYVCLECKVSFMSYNYVKHHLEKFKSPEANSDVVYSSNTFHPGLDARNGFTPVFPVSSRRFEADSATAGDTRSRKRRKRRSRRRGRDSEQTREQSRERSPDHKRERRDEEKRLPEDNRSEGHIRNRLIDDDYIDLRKECIREKDLKNKGLKYVCQLCDRLLADKSQAIEHVANDEHIGNKTGEIFKGVERLFVVDSNLKSTDFFLARKRQLRTVPFNAMEQFVYHGIRLKNGLGSEAFICLTCNQALADIQTIENHIRFLDIHRNIDMADMSGQSHAKEELSKLSALDLEALFRNEGIKHDIQYKDNKRSEQFVCVFCSADFKAVDSVITHLSRPYHRKTKRAEVLRPIDALFVISSLRSDEFDVAFARMTALRAFTNEQKIRYSEEGIRLEDGYGCEAYRCVKCKASIAAESHHSAVNQINKHIDSRQHIDRISL